MVDKLINVQTTSKKDIQWTINVSNESFHNADLNSGNTRHYDNVVPCMENVINAVKAKNMADTTKVTCPFSSAHHAEEGFFIGN